MRPFDKDLPDRYLDGELDPEEKTVFEERLLSEDHLRNYVEEVQALHASAASMEVFKAPGINLSRRVGLPWREMISGRVGPFLSGAALTACILIGIGLGRNVLDPKTVLTRTEPLKIVYYAPGARSVSVLGDFNGWSGEIPLKPRGEGGYWLAEIPVKPGEYRYILKIDGKERVGDPLADYVIDDDFGSKNSVVRIGL
jgi:hypothetical protein